MSYTSTIIVQISLVLSGHHYNFFACEIVSGAMKLCPSIGLELGLGLW
jgi:hypothetical protein